MFCSRAKWIRGARPEITCSACGRLLADGKELLSNPTLEKSIAELLPESVARATNSLGYRIVNGALVCFADLDRKNGIDTAEKIRFILNQNLYNLHVSGDLIESAINYYG